MTSLAMTSVSLALFAALAGCGAAVTNTDGMTPGPDATNDTVLVDTVPVDTMNFVWPVPRYHRTDDTACRATAPAVNCNFGPGGPPGACTADSQCTHGLNGRCAAGPGGGVAFCSCTYDTCTSDSQCMGMGGPCACRGNPYNGQLDNACVAGNCQTDSNCPNGAYCSPSRAAAGCGGLGGYYCHTANDRCTNDTDCPTGTNGPQICVYSTTDMRWACVTDFQCG